MKKESSVQRSHIMAKIRKTDTKPELIVRQFLFKCGFRYRLHAKKLPENPDIVLSKYKTAIFVNGCFWHAHEGCKLNRMPKSRQEYWVPKINGNVKRDIVNHKQLDDLGWRVLVVWECELRKNALVILNKLSLNIVEKYKNK